MPRESIAVRVARGAELLDKHVPNWFRRIDLETLQLSSCSQCICGQLAARSHSQLVKDETKEYGEGWGRYIGFRKWLKSKMAKTAQLDPVEDPAAFGFDAQGETYTSLERAWEREIKARLRAEA